VGIDQGDYFLVHLATKNHLYHIHGLRVGNPHPVDEVGLDVEPVQQIADLGAATVHHDGIDAHQFHQHHIPGEAALELLVFHGVAAVLDHYRLAGKPLDIGQALTQDVCHLHCRITIQCH